MKPEQAIQIIQSLQNLALQKGLFQTVQQVNQVTVAIASLQAVLLEKKAADEIQQ